MSNHFYTVGFENIFNIRSSKVLYIRSSILDFCTSRAAHLPLQPGTGIQEITGIQKLKNLNTQ